MVFLFCFLHNLEVDSIFFTPFLTDLDRVALNQRFPFLLFLFLYYYLIEYSRRLSFIGERTEKLSFAERTNLPYRPLTPIFFPLHFHSNQTMKITFSSLCSFHPISFFSFPPQLHIALDPRRNGMFHTWLRKVTE